MILTQKFLLLLFVILSILYLFDSKLICLTVNNKKTTRNFVIVIISIYLILVAMFRSPSMADYQPYIDDFNYKTEAEPLFLVIKRIAMFISSSNVGLYGIYLFAVISISLRLNFMKIYKPFFIPAILVYMSRVLVEQDMIAIRAGLATAIALYGIYYHTKEKRLKSIVFIVMAVCAHYSALLFLFVPFLNNKRYMAKYYLGGLVLSYLFVFLGIQFGEYLNLIQLSFILDKLDTYTYDDTYNPFNLLHVGHVFVCFVCWYLQIFRMKENTDICGLNASVFLRVYTVGCICGTIFSDIISIAIRSSQLLFSMDIVIIPLYFSYLSKYPSVQRMSIVTYSSVIFYITMTDTFFWLP